MTACRHAFRHDLRHRAEQQVGKPLTSRAASADGRGRARIDDRAFGRDELHDALERRIRPQARIERCLERKRDGREQRLVYDVDAASPLFARTGEVERHVGLRLVLHRERHFERHGLRRVRIVVELILEAPRAFRQLPDSRADRPLVVIEHAIDQCRNARRVAGADFLDAAPCLVRRLTYRSAGRSSAKRILRRMKENKFSCSTPSRMTRIGGMRNPS